jgi:hypothetical protein
LLFNLGTLMKKIHRTSPFNKTLLAIFMSTALSGCLSDDDDDPVVVDDVVVVVNASPVVTSSATIAVTEGDTYTYTFAATDADDDSLTLSATTLPAWLLFDTTTGVLSGSAAAADVGSHDVTLSVSDGTDATTQSFTIDVAAIVVANTAPVISSTAVVSGTVGANYTYIFTATDVDDDTLSMSSGTLPAWAMFDNATGILSGTPDVAGDFAIELMVSDGTDSATQTFTIVVAEASTMTVELVVFENAAQQEWAAWINDGGSTEVVTDDVEHDQATKFTLTAPSVAGFTARETDGAVGGMPFDASAIASTASITFELKMLKAPDAGVVDWKFKVEGGGASELSLSASVEGHATPLLDTWQTYTFPISALNGLDPSNMDLFMVFPDYNSAPGAEFLLDNVKIINDTSGGNTGGDTGGDTTGMTIDEFEGDIASYEFNNFDGGVSTVVSNPDATGINTSAQVVKMEKFAGQTWGGSTLLAVTPFNLPADSSFTLKVWSTRAVDVLFKLEGGPVGERTVTHSGSGWEELSFDFAGVEGAGTNGITVIFDNGIAGDAAGDADNWTFYYDDIVLVEASGGDTGGDTGGDMTVTTIDEFEGDIASYEFNNFDGGVSTVISNPDATGINTSAQVVKMEKFAGQTWGGSTLLAVTPFNLPADSNFTLKVWSTRAVDVLFKLEGGPVGERTVTHSGSGWEELSFDFAGVEGAGTNGITVIFDNGIAGDAAGDADNWTFYYDDIVLNAGSGGGDTGAVAGITDIGDTGFVVNGGFENGNLDSWLAEGANIAAQQDDMGTWLAKVVAPEAQNPFIKQSKIGEGVITPGQALTVSFDMKGTVAGAGGVVNALLFTEASTGVSKTDNLMTVVPTTEWSNYSFNVTAGDDTEWGVALLLQPVCGAVAGCEVTAYFDNVSITAQ